MKASLNKDTIFGLSHFKGAHTYSDAHLYLSNNYAYNLPANLSIENIPSIIKNHFPVVNGQ